MDRKIKFLIHVRKLIYMFVFIKFRFLKFSLLSFDHTGHNTSSWHIFVTQEKIFSKNMREYILDENDEMFCFPDEKFG